LPIAVYLLKCDLVALDHPIKSFPINAKDARCRLHIPARMTQHPRNVSTFYLR
jgi:hypothetical protein